MLSPVIAASQPARSNQLTLDFTPGLLDRHMSLRDCIAAGVYQRGLGRVAIDLNQAPGNLSVQLSEDATRNFSVDNLERYIEKTGDTAPVLYLVEKFLSNQDKDAQATRTKLDALTQIQALMKQAGLA